MLLKNGAQWFPQENDIEKWKLAYQNVDIEQELKNMDCWLDANPQKRKTARGMNRFVNSWLSRTNQNNKQTKNNSTRSTSLHDDLTDTSWAN